MARRGAEGAAQAVWISLGGCPPSDGNSRLAGLPDDWQTLMAGPLYKRRKRGAGRFVQLPQWVQASDAWATLAPGPRALYIELKRRFNGTNNGAIYLSHRDAAAALNVHRNTVGPWFRELEGEVSST